MNKYPVVYEESMNTVLRQELIRFNRLTEVVRSTLYNLQKAIKVMFYLQERLQNVKEIFCQNVANVHVSLIFFGLPVTSKLKSLQIPFKTDLIEKTQTKREGSSGRISFPGLDRAQHGANSTDTKHNMKEESRASLLNKGFTVKLYDKKTGHRNFALSILVQFWGFHSCCGRAL